MEGGVGWWSQVEAALDQVKFLVIVVTPHALTSRMTWREWRVARQKGVNVYPVKGVPDRDLNYDALPNWIRKAHFFDIGQWTGSAWINAKEWQTICTSGKGLGHPIHRRYFAEDLVRLRRASERRRQPRSVPELNRPERAFRARVGARRFGIKSGRGQIQGVHLPGRQPERPSCFRRCRSSGSVWICRRTLGPRLAEAHG
jgi:hypothetical protein